MSVLICKDPGPCICCITPPSFNIKIGNRYRIVYWMNDDYVKIENDYGYECIYNTKFFHTKDQWRNIQLEKVIND